MSLKINFLDRQNMSFYMSVMINEALSFKITEILNFKICKNPPFLVKCTPFSQMKFFPNFLAIYIGQEYDLCFLENFDPLYAIVMAYKWLTSEKSVPHPSKTIKNFKKLEMVRRLKLNFMLFCKF